MAAVSPVHCTHKHTGVPTCTHIMGCIVVYSCCHLHIHNSYNFSNYKFKCQSITVTKYLVAESFLKQNFQSCDHITHTHCGLHCHLFTMSTRAYTNLLHFSATKTSSKIEHIFMVMPKFQIYLTSIWSLELGP